MKFFLPAATDENEAESVHNSIRAFVSQQMNYDLSPRRIFSLEYRHDGKDYHAEVGKVHSRVHELVVAILYTEPQDLYYVCTYNRGVAGGIPVLIGGNEVRRVIDFDSD